MAGESERKVYLRTSSRGIDHPCESSIDADSVRNAHKNTTLTGEIWSWSTSALQPFMKYCPRGHVLSADNTIRNAKRKYYWCRECRRMHQWLIKRGLHLSDYSPFELSVIVPPRERRAHFKTGPRAALAAQLVLLSRSASSRAEER
jgi:hypothetical protein